MVRSLLIPVALLAALSLVGVPAQGSPTVASLTPADEAVDVDPATTELVVTFDHDMDTKVGWSVCGGGPTFPKVGEIAWRDARTLVLTVTLAPATRYEMPLNCAGSSQRFRDARGQRLPPTPWSFTTRDDRVADAAQVERNTMALARLRELIDSRYSYRDRVVPDWDTVFAGDRERILAAADDRAFAARAARMLAAAEDLHLWIGPGDERGTTFRSTWTPNFDLGVLERAIPGLQKENDVVWHGVLRDGRAPRSERTVGYLLIRSLGDERAIAAAQDVLDDLAGSCDALVLDLRPNGGGNELLAMQIAAWFVDGRKVYAGHVTRDEKTGRFDEKHERTIVGNGGARRFDKPVAVLIGPGCVSSCEAFVLMMRQAGKAVLIGARTRGASGNPQPYELGNGVTVWLPSWRATDTDGHPFEGAGIAPDIAVETSPRDFADGDPVLARALSELARRR
ncbi:MAG: Ig-like domain-containing protein [Planctomycetes bacterium]|nr:Ig-like domain-containing protein [Planctomycetota bacterium]